MPTQQLDYFASLVAEDEHFPLTEASIAIGQHAFPDLVVQHVFDELDVLVEKLKHRITSEMAGIQKLQILKNYFYKELGFGPNRNDYYDPNNSYLHTVLETRRGIPISLALIFMEMGNQIGLNIKGVSFPNHFMVRLSLPQGEVILDPLTGTSLSKQELQEMLDPYLDAQGYRGEYQLPLSAFLRSSSPREILSRFLRNLKAIYTQQERWERLLGIQQRLVILLPDAIEEIRDRGLALAQLDYIRPAIEDMQKYLDESQDATDSDEIRAQIIQLEEQYRHH
jgi:regulator of sirC expression with transglutaminase-like and TPR domain